MEAVEPSHILAVAARLTAPAWRIGTVLLWKLRLAEDDVAVHVGDRNLRCRYQIKIVEIDMIHLSFLVGELTGAVARGLVYYERRFHLGVSCVPCLVQEELN